MKGIEVHLVGRLSKGAELYAKGRHIGYYNEDKSQIPQVFMIGFVRPKSSPKGAE